MDVSRARAVTRRKVPSADQVPYAELLAQRASTSASPYGRGFPDPLADYGALGGSWEQGPVAITRRTTIALWVLVACGIGGCVALLTILRDQDGCSGLPCSVATYGGRPLTTLLLAAAGTAALLGTAVFTRGLTRLSAWALWLVIPAAGLTLVSVAGLLVVLAAMILIAVTTIVAVLLVFAMFSEQP